MHHIRIDITITFESKWHCGSGEGGVQADRLIRRDTRGRPYIPGSTLKGVVRECCEKLTRTMGFPEPVNPHSEQLRHDRDFFCPLREVRSPVDAVFGNKCEEGGIIFRDARIEQQEYRTGSFLQARTRMFRGLRTATDKHLFSSEFTIPLRFGTIIEGYHRHLVSFDAPDARNPEYPPYGYCMLVAGLLAVDRLGGDKSTGSGRVGLHINSVIYNGKTFSVEKIIEVLEPEFYEDSLRSQRGTFHREPK